MRRMFALTSIRRSGTHVTAQWVGSLFPTGMLYCQDRRGVVTDIIRDGRMTPVQGIAKAIMKYNRPESHDRRMRRLPEPDRAQSLQERREQRDRKIREAIKDPDQAGEVLTGRTEGRSRTNGRISRVAYTPDTLPDDMPVLFSFENTPPAALAEWMPFCQPIMNLRDPFNNWASTVQRSAAHGRNRVDPDSGSTGRVRKQSLYTPLAAFPLIWSSFASEFIGDTDHLGGTAIKLDYNKWATDEMYRHELAVDIGMPFNDVGLNSIPTYGGGSSFMGYDPDSDRSFTERWKRVQHNETWLALFKQQGAREMVELAEVIWPELTREVLDTLGILPVDL